MTTLSPFWDQNYKTSNSVDNFKVTEQLNPNQLTRGQPYGDTSPNELGEYSPTKVLHGRTDTLRV